MIKVFNTLFILFFIVFTSNLNGQIKDEINNALYSIETAYTISKVRTALKNGKPYIIASSFEGTLLGVSYEGETLWENKLSGFMNHDIWCQDITGNGADEIMVANADGTIYCLDGNGKLLWDFKKNDAPMYAVCVVKAGDTAYVVAGGFDKNIYYISPEGQWVKTLKSSTYSDYKTKVNHSDKKIKAHTANFIRPVDLKSGKQVLVVLGTNNHMNVPGSLYFFNILENLPYKKVPLRIKGKRVRPLGDFKVLDINNDNHKEIYLGTSAHAKDFLTVNYDLATEKLSINKINKVRFGYDIVQTVTITDKNENQYLTKFGNQFSIYNPNDKTAKVERLKSKYAYNDIWKDDVENRVLLASSQSGGSCIHIINTQHKNWKKRLENLEPKGKIQTILDNTNHFRDKLQRFKKPERERAPLPVYLLTEKVPLGLEHLKNKITTNYKSPIFLNAPFLPNVENWDRSNLGNEKFKKKRDRRKKYILDQDAALEKITASYANAPGIAYWAGHGNDPYMFSKQTTKKVVNFANRKKTVLIYPEMEDHTNDLNFLVDDLIYPLAEYAQDKNTNIFLRSKNIFWLGSNYQNAWSRLMSGEFANVFVPSMEETTDKTMELSLVGRVGMWASGAVNSWGTRSVPDNTAFDRSRQQGYQQLPNHFLRMLIFHTANGAQYINNFAVDQQYLSLYWELIATGALYVPKRSEILSFSPVHLSMTSPDSQFLNEGTNVKPTIFFDETFLKENPYVFSRMNGSWPAAPVTTWDFSRYAAGVKERRLNFLAPYNNGLVLITPPQKGVFAVKNAPRGLLEDNLHPFYKNILKEYITDGKSYYSSNGKQAFEANQYYKTIEADIKASAKELPLTVEGDVAWVVAQTSPKHLRLTIIDNGYLNPKKRLAKVKFHKVLPIKITDIINKTTYKVSTSKIAEINIPLGLFRFIDIELDKAL
ncbi:hypothetical protein [uncultured Algibacter sp.]|uniref:hypothetical protein n=1 Tax=uncultured Algibacter sp. TaxID=298659 RepID=UPI0032162C4A